MQIKHFNFSRRTDHVYFAGAPLRILARAAPSLATVWLAKLRRGMRSRLPLQRQSESSGAGLTCISMLAGFHRLPADPVGLHCALFAQFSTLTLAQLIQSAGMMGLHCRPLRIQPCALGALKLPAILQMHSAHYVVLKSLRKDRLTMHDPASGITQLSLEEVAQRFTGIAIEVEPSGKFCECHPSGAGESSGLADHAGDSMVYPRRKILPVIVLVLAVIFLSGHFASS